MKYLVQFSKNIIPSRFLYQYSTGFNSGDAINSQVDKYSELYENAEIVAKEGLKKLSESLAVRKSVEITKEKGYLYGALWELVHGESYDASKSFKEVRDSGNKDLLKKQASVLLALKELTANGFDVNSFNPGEKLQVSANGELSIGKNKIEIRNGEISRTENINEAVFDKAKAVVKEDLFLNKTRKSIDENKSNYNTLIQNQNLSEEILKIYNEKEINIIKEFFLALPKEQEKNLQQLLAEKLPFEKIEKRINLYTKLSDPATIDSIQATMTTFGAEGRTEDQIAGISKTILSPKFDVTKEIKCEFEGWDEGHSANYNKTGSEIISQKEFIARILNDSSDVSDAFSISKSVSKNPEDPKKIGRLKEFISALEGWQKIEFDQNIKATFLEIHDALNNGDILGAVGNIQKIMSDSDFHEQADWNWEEGYAEKIDANDIAVSDLSLAKAYRALGNAKKSGEMLLGNLENEIASDENKKSAAGEIFDDFEKNMQSNSIQKDAVETYEKTLETLNNMSQKGVQNLQYLQMLKKPEASIQQLIFLKAKEKSFNEFFDKHSRGEIEEMFGSDADYYMDMTGLGNGWSLLNYSD